MLSFREHRQGEYVHVYVVAQTYVIFSKKEKKKTKTLFSRCMYMISCTEKNDIYNI